MSDRLDQLDEVSASLVSAYAREGKFAVVVRAMDGKESDIRAIYLRTEVPKVSQFLSFAADAIFNGPATIVDKIRRLGGA